MFGKTVLNFFKKLFGKAYNNDFLLYLSSNESLPSPMEADEELECIESMSKGNVEAKNKLIERNLRLVVYIAKKFENSGVDLEDLISVGSIGLIKAVKTFNLNKKIKLATYASRCIENEILMHLRKTSKQKKETSLDKPLSCDSDGNELLLSDILGVDADEVFAFMDQKVEKDAVYKVLNKLSQKEQTIVKLRFGLGNEKEKTQKEVADILNISQSYISRIEKKILVKMKKSISKHL